MNLTLLMIVGTLFMLLKYLVVMLKLAYGSFLQGIPTSFCRSLFNLSFGFLVAVSVIFAG